MTPFADDSQRVATPLLDAHVHLQDDRLAADLPEFLRRAAERGVAAWLCNGSQESDWPRVLALARTYPAVIPCFGLHPWYAAERSSGWLATLRAYLLAAPSAVGEVGLDRHHAPDSAPAQEEVLKSQIRLARELARPIVIHCVRAWDGLRRVLNEEPPPVAGLLLHAFGGSADEVRWFARYERAYFSLAGNALRTPAPRRLEALRAIPPDRLLIETDAPDLAPPPEFRAASALSSGAQAVNEPANLPGILRGVAYLLQLDEQALAAAVWRNAREFIASWHPAPPSL